MLNLGFLLQKFVQGFCSKRVGKDTSQDIMLRAITKEEII
jgi:hypothetical protein